MTRLLVSASPFDIMYSGLCMRWRLLMRLLNLEPASTRSSYKRHHHARRSNASFKPSSNNKTGDNQQNLKTYPLKTRWKPKHGLDVSRLNGWWKSWPSSLRQKNNYIEWQDVPKFTPVKKLMNRYSMQNEDLSNVSPASNMVLFWVSILNIKGGRSCWHAPIINLGVFILYAEKSQNKTQTLLISASPFNITFFEKYWVRAWKPTQYALILQKTSSCENGARHTWAMHGYIHPQLHIWTINEVVVKQKDTTWINVE